MQATPRRSVDGQRRSSLVNELMMPPIDYSYFPERLREHPYDVKPTPKTKPSRSDLLRAFPSIVANLRWNPLVETVPLDPSASRHRTQCPCEKCKRAAAPLRPVRGVLCNQQTMTTPKVTDASCNVRRSITRPPRRDAAVTASSYSHVPRHPHHSAAFKYDSHSVMKLSNCECMGECVPRRSVTHYRPISWQPVRDMDNESALSFCKVRTKCSRGNSQKRPTSACSTGSRSSHGDESRCERRELYNEGIRDGYSNPCQRPRRVARAPCCTQYMPTFIPYSHTGKSKYHHHCQDQPALRYQGGGPEPRWTPCRHEPPRRPPTPPRYAPCRRIMFSECEIDELIRQSNNCRERSSSRHHHDCCLSRQE